MIAGSSPALEIAKERLLYCKFVGLIGVTLTSVVVRVTQRSDLEIPCDSQLRLLIMIQTRIVARKIPLMGFPLILRPGAEFGGDGNFFRGPRFLNGLF